MDGALPCFMPEKIICDARVLCRRTGLTDLRAQATAQESLKERMQAVLFTAFVRGDGDKDVAPDKRGQHSRTAFRWIETPARLKV